jgi:hypothetical protein
MKKDDLRKKKEGMFCNCCGCELSYNSLKNGFTICNKCRLKGYKTDM